MVKMEMQGKPVQRYVNQSKRVLHVQVLTYFKLLEFIRKSKNQNFFYFLLVLFLTFLLNYSKDTRFCVLKIPYSGLDVIVFKRYLNLLVLIVHNMCFLCFIQGVIGTQGNPGKMGKEGKRVSSRKNNINIIINHRSMRKHF